MKGKLAAGAGLAQALLAKAVAKVNVNEVEFFRKAKIFLENAITGEGVGRVCLLYTSPSPRDM